MDGIADDLYRKVRPTERSIELLRSWLTTDQLHQFDEHGWFIVRGSDTGKRYRINSADVAYNIHELDDDGRRAFLCRPGRQFSNRRYYADAEDCI
jgi:hypothetical protein